MLVHEFLPGGNVAGNLVRGALVVLGLVFIGLFLWTLTEPEIRRYVERDNPVDCAGGFKSEETGTALLRAMRSDDPTAIIGLPLISLAEALREAGYVLP